jgi:pimeloyl-ACP methyl ester carboxylesterase
MVAQNPFQMQDTLLDHSKELFKNERGIEIIYDDDRFLKSSFPHLLWYSLLEKIYLIFDLISEMLSTAFMGLLVICAYIQNYRLHTNWWRVDKGLKNVISFIWSLFHVHEEKITMDEKYYALRYGYLFETHEVVTKDGFVLSVHRIRKPSFVHEGTPMPAVILQHGLFQSSGIFLMNEEESLAFYLADKGYDVWLGNNRCVFDKHISLSKKDPKYWDWCLDDLAKYDFPAIIDCVCRHSMQEKVYFIGHSQGNAQAFMGLSFNPQICDKIKLFVALAPAFYIKPPNHWALKLMLNLEKKLFHALLGRKAFVPMMCDMQKFLPISLYTNLAFNMFCYLFNWNDSLWDPRRKSKYFLFSPRLVSCKLLWHWTNIMRQGVIHPLLAEKDNQCKLENITCPLAMFYSDEDSLVNGESLLKELQVKKINLIHAEKVKTYEHMDLIWAKNSV